ncbi:hypothetical protein WME75_40150 [Sorangium sp. So ce1014]|uniref:hypothetical protein n=1 Tax=Sorangium sp. So ce1014 TaxID=3133326 RepID=UPI003F5EE392
MKNSSKPTSSKVQSSSKTPAPRTKRPASPAHDPTGEEALLALDPIYATGPDMPVSVAERELTSITRKDLDRAKALADALEGAAANEASDASAAHALELRNRCFWAADELAKEIREGGRYAFRDQPKIAARFVSRHRTTLNRRSRRKAKAAESLAAPEV